MTTKDVKRKLRAILSADVQGYSRLMGDDEVATVKTITEYRETLTSLVNQYTGRVVDSPGDNVLAVFGSVVDAVQCAVEIQNVLKAKNEDLPENRRMIFRIGVNLGDVIQEGDRIYGDGVNIAARIESLADGGGICISGTAYDHIENKLALGYNFMGKHSVKNIAKPIRVYKVPMDPKDVGKKRDGKSWKKMAIAAAIVLILGTVSFAVWNFYLRPPQIEPASVEKMAFPLPNKPSIAVLPFNNLSGDPTQDYIADGISENIISALSKISEMFVIASNSTFTYKGKPVKVQQVSEELGVRYVLEGSAQKIGNRIRITAQLIDATTGHHLWSEKYDRDLKDLFALQDEITQKIIVELQVKLTEGEQARVSKKTTTNLEAWSCAVRGLTLFKRASKENTAKAIKLFERAVKLDPNYVWAWVRLAWMHYSESRYSQSPSESFKKAVQISQKVLALNDSDPDVLALLGIVYLRQKRYKEAIAEGKKATELGPTNAHAYLFLAVTMYTVGRFDDAIPLVKKAMRVHPYYPAYYLMWLGSAYRMTGRYEEALTVYKQFLDRSLKGEFPPYVSHLFLAEVYAELGQDEKARTHAAEVLRLNPEFSLKWISKLTTYEYKDPAHLERRVNALRKAGLK
jgi:adenylate cyclase